MTQWQLFISIHLHCKHLKLIIIYLNISKMTFQPIARCLQTFMHARWMYRHSYLPTLNVCKYSPILTIPVLHLLAILFSLIEVILGFGTNLLTSLLQVIYWAPDELSSQMSWALPHGGYDARTIRPRDWCYLAFKVQWICVTIQLCVHVRVLLQTFSRECHSGCGLWQRTTFDLNFLVSWLW